jgi:hypothetical protein
MNADIGNFRIRERSMDFRDRSAGRSESIDPGGQGWRGRFTTKRNER